MTNVIVGILASHAVVFVEGSEPVPCRTCGQGVLLAPSSLALIAQGSHEVSCAPCLDVPIAGVNLAPGAKAEIEGYFGKGDKKKEWWE